MIRSTTRRRFSYPLPARFFAGGLLLIAVSGCNMFSSAPPAAAVDVAPAVLKIDRPELLAAVELPAITTPAASPVSLFAGRSEWVSFVLRVHAPPAGQATTLRLPALQAGNDKLRAKPPKVYQIVSMPLDVNRAGYVRQTGQSVAAESLPRALLPVQMQNGTIDLAKLRDPTKPADATSIAVNQDVLLWVDLRVGIDAVPGHYATTLVMEAEVPGEKPEQTKIEPKATLAVNLDVADFVLPDDRHLTMVADLSWDKLRRLWPDRFEAVRPQLLSRKDADSKAAIATLDGLVALAQENRVQVHIPRLQPVVKWKPGPQAQISWDDYDDLVGPWLSGKGFADRVPLGFWALPRVDFLSNLTPAAQAQYYTAAASHFDQRDWLRLSPVILSKETPGRASVTERLTLSAEASRVLQSHPRVRVLLPLEPAEVQLANAQNANMIDRDFTGRLNCVAPGLISNSALSAWPAELEKPQNWLRTDLAGLIPYTGAGGDESDVRVWSWVAFLRRADVIQWEGCLPIESRPDKPADPNELVWFYPGSWFGVDEPVQTVQLKWLRRAQQDFEYLRLAAQRGSALDVLPMARVLAKPVEIQPGQSPDAVYGLLIGTADAKAWAAARTLLIKILQARGPGIRPDTDAINNLGQQELQWMQPLERPVILARRTDWTVGAPPEGQPGPWVNLRLGFDLYNASDTTPAQNFLSFHIDPAAKTQSDGPAPGWVVSPVRTPIPKLSMFQVARQGLGARLDPTQVVNAWHAPVRLDYRSGETGVTTPLDVVAPVSRSVRRTAPLLINGSLDDWTQNGDDPLQTGPLVKMMNRPTVQQHALQYASTPSDLYSAWGDEDFYLAFRVEGLSATKAVQASRNFIDYQNGRAWGEDVCEAVMQAVYEDGATGPLVHVAVKPGGNVWIERRDRPGQPWVPVQTAVRYATTADKSPDKSIWRGELAVPWSALINPDKTDELNKLGRPNLPTILRFNFIQHKHDTGESASWAGPIDGGRDDDFSGVLVLKEAQ